MPQFIALCGRGTRNNEFVTTARVGKDEVARIFREIKNYRSYSFALPLKQTAQILFGLTDEQVWDDKLKEVIVPEWGLTPRKIFQLLGTEGGRLIFHEDIWGDLALNVWDQVKSGVSKEVVGVGEHTTFLDNPSNINDLNNILRSAGKLLFQVSDSEADFSLAHSTNINNWSYTFEDVLFKLKHGTIPAILGGSVENAWARYSKIRTQLPTIDLVGNGPYGAPPPNPDGMVIPDCRFDNEGDITRAVDGHVVHVCREIPLDINIVSGHASEKGVTIKEGDLFIQNDSTLESLNAKVDELLLQLDKSNTLDYSL